MREIIFFLVLAWNSILQFWWKNWILRFWREIQFCGFGGKLNFRYCDKLDFVVLVGKLDFWCFDGKLNLQFWQKNHFVVLTENSILRFRWKILILWFWLKTRFVSLTENSIFDYDRKFVLRYWQKHKRTHFAVSEVLMGNSLLHNQTNLKLQYIFNII